VKAVGENQLITEYMQDKLGRINGSIQENASKIMEGKIFYNYGYASGANNRTIEDGNGTGATTYADMTGRPVIVKRALAKNWMDIPLIAGILKTSLK